MTTTYDYVKIARDIAYTLEDTLGDVTPEIEAAIAALMDGAPSKLEALYHVTARLEVERLILANEADRLKAASQRMRANQERVKQMAADLMRSMRDLGELEAVKADGTGGKLRTPTLTVWLQANAPALEAPEDAADWPEEWREEVTSVRLDRKAALVACKADAAPVGFSLRRGESLRWR